MIRLIVTVSLEFDLISVQLRAILCLIQQKLQLDYQDVLPFISARRERHNGLRNRLSIGHYNPRRFTSFKLVPRKAKVQCALLVNDIRKNFHVEHSAHRRHAKLPFPT